MFIAKKEFFYFDPFSGFLSSPYVYRKEQLTFIPISITSERKHEEKRKERNKK